MNRSDALPASFTPPREGIRHPLVWLGVIGVSLLVVAVLARILWISLPTILALVVYYVCAPAVGRLKRAGLNHPQAVLGLTAAVVGGATLLFAVLFPWAAAQVYRLQSQGGLYVEHGEAMAINLLQSAEAQFPSLAKAHLADEVRNRLEGWTGHFVERNIDVGIGLLATWLPALLLVPYLTFFFLRDGPAFKKLLAHGVPNAFFEKGMLLFHRMDEQIHLYFRGMVMLTFLDTVTLGIGLWVLGRQYGHGVFGFGHSLFLGLVCAVFAWVPYVGSLAGCLLVALVCATEAPDAPVMVLGAVVLFALARLVDDFFYSPMTVGRSMNIHPLLTVVMIFISGAVGGIAGLFLVLPVLGMCAVAGEMFEQVWFDEHLRARHAHATALRKRAAAESIKY